MKDRVILAVDATGDDLTVALAARGKRYRARRSSKVPHDEALLPAVEGLMKRARISWKDLDAVAAAAGPGRFTGIRIGLSFAAVVGMERDIPALALSRLEAAADACAADDVLAALPGWKDEVYHQRFRRAGARLKADGPAEWSAAAAWPARKGSAESRGLAVAYGPVGACELLLTAARRLGERSLPPFEPFYLKPAGYEKPRR